jgi:hypothetical protein
MKAALREVRPLFSKLMGYGSHLPTWGEDVAKRQEGVLYSEIPSFRKLARNPLCPVGHLPPSREIDYDTIAPLFMGRKN